MRFKSCASVKDFEFKVVSFEEDIISIIIITYIMKTVDEQLSVYNVLPGHTAHGGGSIPPELCVTVQKLDKVILNKPNIHLFQFT